MSRLLFYIAACCILLFPTTNVLAGSDGRLLAVNIHTLAQGMEDIAFTLDRKTFPDIMILNGKRPRVVYDFIGFSKSSQVKNHIGPGSLVRSLRLGIHNDPQAKIRGVLDMEPGMAYRINHFFDKKTSIFHATVIATNDPIPPGKSIAVRFSHEQSIPAPQTVAAVPKTPAPVKKLTPPKRFVAAAKTPRPPQKNASLDGLAEIREVRFQKSSEQGEMVLFTMKAFKPPRVHAMERGGGVQVLCNFPGTTVLSNNIPASKNVDGKFIKRILIKKRQKTASSVQVTLELAAGKNYDVQQMFFKKDNLYAIILQDLENISLDR